MYKYDPVYRIFPVLSMLADEVLNSTEICLYASLTVGKIQILMRQYSVWSSFVVSYMLIQQTNMWVGTFI